MRMGQDDQELSPRRSGAGHGGDSVLGGRALFPGRRAEAVRVAPMLFLMALLFTWPIFVNVDNLGIQDWDSAFMFTEVARVSVCEYHQLPLWNPYVLGGTEALAFPESRGLSPFSPLAAVLGTVRGMKVELLAHLFLGLMGTYLLARDFGLHPAGSLFASAFASLNSGFFLISLVGMANMWGGVWLPYVVLYLRRALRTESSPLVWGSFLAIVLMDGCPYPFVSGALLALLYCVAHLRQQRWVHVARVFGVGVAGMLLFGAAKILPSTIYILNNPRPSSARSGFTAKTLLHGLLGSNQRLESLHGRGPRILNESHERAQIGQTAGPKPVAPAAGMDEIGMYVGWFGLAAAAVGTIVSFKRLWRLHLINAVFVWLMFGWNAPVNPYPLFAALPGLSSMRVPERYRFVVLLLGGIAAGEGVQWLWRQGASRGGRRLAGAVCVAATTLFLGDLFRVNGSLLRDAFPYTPPRWERYGSFVQRWLPERFFDLDRVKEKWGNAWPLYQPWCGAYAGPKRNCGLIFVGTLNINVRRAAVPMEAPSYRGEAYLLSGQGRAGIRRWSPNKIVCRAASVGRDVLIVNMNYAPGWWEKGEGRWRPVRPHGGLLAAAVTPTVKRVTFAFLPFDALLGFAVSVGWLAFLSLRVVRGCLRR